LRAGWKIVEGRRDGRGMLRNPRLLDLTLILGLLSVVALSQRMTDPKTATPPTNPPSVVVPSPATPSPTEGGVWQDSSLSLTLRRLPGPLEARRARLQLSLTNQSSQSCWIPGTFCQEGEEADWWSHAVRVKVDYAYRADLACPLEPGLNPNPKGPWILGPSYGERDLHEHPSFPSLIKPQQTLSWEFCLGDLVQGTDSTPPAEGWERAEGPFLLTCQLSQPDHGLQSNTLTLEDPRLPER